MRLGKEAERDGAYRVAKRLQAVVLNSDSHSSGELAGILKAPRSKVSEWLARYEAYVGRFESPTSAARQLMGVLSTRVAVLSNQHHFALAGDGHNHHGRGHGEKRVAEPMAARADLYVGLFQREPTICGKSSAHELFLLEGLTSEGIL